jgi:hypothetical protein
LDGALAAGFGGRAIPMSEAFWGWAVTVNGRINLRTVSDTRRSAMVNFLHTKVRPIRNSMTNAEIEAIWERVHKAAHAKVVEVYVVEKN